MPKRLNPAGPKNVGFREYESHVKKCRVLWIRTQNHYFLWKKKDALWTSIGADGNFELRRTIFLSQTSFILTTFIEKYTNIYNIK
jgi:hypothetical protein